MIINQSMMSRVLFLGAMVAGSFAAPTAQAALFDSNDLLVAEFNNQQISIYDENFAFKGVFAGGVGQILTLDFTPGGNVVTTNRSSQIREYDPNGGLVGTYSNSTSNPFDVKTGADGRIYTGNQAGTVREFNPDGTAPGRSFGSANNFGAVAVLPGNKLWISGSAVGNIRVIDLATGAQTDTLAWDGGQNNADSMRYNVETNTVLISSANSATIWERDLSGTLLRTFTPGVAISSFYGNVDRGPNGEVWMPSFEGASLLRWSASGDFLGTTALPGSSGPFGVLWTGGAHVPEPSAMMALAAAIGVCLRRRRRMH